ncbi:ABC transporter permease [bacterium]|nr:ABC transporter permease [bacterium]
MEPCKQKTSPLLALPAIGWFLWFFLIPLSIVLSYSFATKGVYGGVVFRLNWENYSRAADWIYLRILWNSFKLASITSVLCLIIGYPMAFVMATASRGVRSLLLILVVIPFWTNFVVRAYATKTLFGEWGPLNQFALQLGLIQEPMNWSQGDFSILLGMVTNYLPFMVLPLFVSLDKFDFSLLEAGRDLGASSLRVLKDILIPLTKKGIVTGLIFVFTPALGEFVIPDLLGGAKTMLIGNLITEQFLKTRDWPFGAALSMLLILMVMLSLVIYLRVEFSDRPKKSTRGRRVRA